MTNFAGRLFAGRLFGGQLFGRRPLPVIGPTDTDHYRRWARDAVALRVANDANHVMVAIGRRRQR